MPRSSHSERPWLNRAFTVLGDPLCREIIELIIQKPGLLVSEVCQQFAVSRFAIMRHLNLLEDAQLLTRERIGKTKKLYIDQANLARLSQGWLAKVSTQKPQEGDEL